MEKIEVRLTEEERRLLYQTVLKSNINTANKRKITSYIRYIIRVLNLKKL